MLIRIPKRFLDDHEERDLPTPKVWRVTKQHYWISIDSPELDELYSDAKFYADPWGPDFLPPGLRNAARALVRAIDKHR